MYLSLREDECRRHCFTTTRRKSKEISINRAPLQVATIFEHNQMTLSHYAEKTNFPNLFSRIHQRGLETPAQKSQTSADAAATRLCCFAVDVYKRYYNGIFSQDLIKPRLVLLNSVRDELKTKAGKEEQRKRPFKARF